MLLSETECFCFCNVSQKLKQVGRRANSSISPSILALITWWSVSGWGACVLFFFMFTASNQNPPRRQFSPFYPQIRATFNEFMKHAHTPAGGNGAHLSLSAPAIRKTDASQNSCGTLVDGKALHGLGSWGDSWARHKQIRVADCLKSSIDTITFNKHTLIITVNTIVAT